MGKKKTEVAKVKTGPLVKPDWYEDGDADGIENLDQYVIPPRLKIIQSNATKADFGDFEAGDVIAMPQKVLVAGQDNPFYFVPLFFFPEWCLWNPISAKGTLPAIRERTTDPEDPMVAMSRNPKLWEKEIDGYMCRYVEHLNFIILILGESEIAGTPMLLTFSRAEHKQGSNFASGIKMRKAHIYSCQFQGTVGFRTNNKGEWYGIDVSNPSLESGVPPFVQDKETCDRFKLMHDSYKEDHKKAILRADYDDSTAPATTDDSNPF